MSAPTEKDLIYYLATLEVAANSVAYCFEKNAGNFALALSCMKHDAEQARQAIKRWKDAHSDD